MAFGGSLGLEDSIRFGEFRLDLPAGRLLCGEREVPLRPKAWEVLCFLAQRPDQVVSIDTLMDACWRNLHVGPNALTNVIYGLRSALADAGGEAAWIQTVPRRGYRFSMPKSNARSAPAPSVGVESDPGAASTALFVGRRREIATLEQCWTQVMGRTPRSVLISGAPGIGKSTLVRNFCAAASPSPQVGIGRCIPQNGEAEPYMPVLEALGSLASSPDAIEIVRTHAPTWLLQMPWLLSREERDALRRSLEDAGSTRMLREGKRLFAALSERAPTLLVLEDVHWADGATVDLIRALAGSDDPGRFMLIATYRLGEVDHPLREFVSDFRWQARKVELLALGSLTPAMVREYLELRFAHSGLAAEIAPVLEERSGGNPLFLDALCDDLCERGRIVREDNEWRLASGLDALEIGLPDGLREMVRAHLRRLAPAEIDLLQAAGAAGMDFTTIDVAAALETSVQEAAQICETLSGDGHFIRPVGEVVWPDGSVGDTYRFTHAVYHQAVCDDTTPSRRRLLHGRIGQRLEAGFGKRAREIAPRIAAHFGAASDPERQVQYLKLSIQLSAGRYAHRETLAFIDRTLEVLGRLPQTPERVTLQLGWHLERSNLLMEWQGYSAGYGGFVRAADFARIAENPLLEFITHTGLCLCGLMGRSHRDRAAAEAEILLAMATDSHPEFVAHAHLLAGCVSHSFGDLERALVHAHAALEALPDAMLGIPRGLGVEGVIHVLLLTALTQLGRPDEARREREVVIRGAETRAGLGAQSYTFAFLACDALIADEPAAALSFAERAIECAREGGFDHFLTAAEAARESARSMLAPDDEIDVEGLLRLEAAIEKRRRGDENWYNMLFAAYLADAYRRRGDLEQARGLIESTFADAEIVYVPELWRIKGEIELAAATTGPPRSRNSAAAEALRCFRSAIDLARRHGTRLFEERSAVALARANQTTAVH